MPYPLCCRRWSLAFCYWSLLVNKARWAGFWKDILMCRSSLLLMRPSSRETVVAFPLMYQSTKAAFQSIDTRLEDAARTLGAGEWRVFLTITVPLAWPGLVAGLVLSFARALGEFGATIMVAGNIPGKTQTIPLAIFFAAESNDMTRAGIYVLIISLITFSMILWVNMWSRNKKQQAPAKGAF